MNARNARETEQRRTDALITAIASLVGTRRAEELIETVGEPFEHEAQESAPAKLARMRESDRGKQWLREHPDASWEEVAAAGI